MSETEPKTNDTPAGIPVAEQSHVTTPATEPLPETHPEHAIPIRASKERARDAQRYANELKNPNKSQEARDQVVQWLNTFLLECEAKLPTEASYDREKLRKRVRKPKAKGKPKKG